MRVTMLVPLLLLIACGCHGFETGGNFRRTLLAGADTGTTTSPPPPANATTSPPPPTAGATSPPPPAANNTPTTNPPPATATTSPPPPVAATTTPPPATPVTPTNPSASVITTFDSGDDASPSPEEESPSPEAASAPINQTAATSAVVSSAKEVPAVVVSQKLMGYSKSTFNETEQTKFSNTVKENLYNISGPVTVAISNVHDGSVVFDTTVAFLNGNNASASAYKTALSTNAAAIYGSGYDVTVDTTSIKDAVVPNTSGAAGLFMSLTSLAAAFFSVLFVL